MIAADSLLVSPVCMKKKKIGASGATPSSPPKTLKKNEKISYEPRYLLVFPIIYSGK